MATLLRKPVHSQIKPWKTGTDNIILNSVLSENGNYSNNSDGKFDFPINQNLQN